MHMVTQIVALLIGSPATPPDEAALLLRQGRYEELRAEAIGGAIPT